MLRQTTWKMALLFLVYVLQGVLANSQQEAKIWTPSTNYDNPRNWANGQIPCAKDRIIFPSDRGVVTFLPESVIFSDMVLPMNGELILRKDMKVFGGVDTDVSCKGQDVLFVVHTDTWYDPANWNISSAHAHPGTGPRKNLAVPDAFAIPCPKDQVIFPEGSSFKVQMDSSTPLVMSAISINGLSYDNDELQSLLASHTGKLLFSGSPQMVVTGESCTDPTGCVCGNEKPVVLNKICSQVKCPATKCSNPITAVGQCCPFCGAYLSAEYDSGFQLQRYTYFLKSRLSKVKYRSVESYTAKTHLRDIQSIFVDSRDGVDSAAEVAQRIVEDLSKDIEGANTNRLKSVRLFVSGQKGGDVPGHSAYSSQGISPGGVATIIIIFTLIGAGAAAWYIYKRRQIPGFSFARFDFHSSKIELELGTTPHEDLQPGDTGTPTEHSMVAKAFDNPVYDTVKEIKDEPLIEDIEGEADAEENVVENPMFMVFDNTQDE